MALSDVPRLEGWLTLTELAERLSPKYSRQGVHYLAERGAIHTLRYIPVGAGKKVFVLREAELPDIQQRLGSAWTHIKAQEVDSDGVSGSREPRGEAAGN